MIPTSGLPRLRFVLPSLLLVLLFGSNALRADQSVTITKINGVAIPPDQVSVPFSTNQVFNIEWQAVDTDCNAGVQDMAVLVDGVQQPSSSGSGFSGFVQLDQTNFPTHDCLHTIEIRASFRQPAVFLNCQFLGNPIFSSPAQLWSTDYRTCT